MTEAVLSRASEVGTRGLKVMPPALRAGLKAVTKEHTHVPQMVVPAAAYSKASIQTMSNSQ